MGGEFFSIIKNFRKTSIRHLYSFNLQAFRTLSSPSYPPFCPGLTGFQEKTGCLIEERIDQLPVFDEFEDSNFYSGTVIWGKDGNYCCVKKKGLIAKVCTYITFSFCTN